MIPCLALLKIFELKALLFFSVGTQAYCLWKCVAHFVWQMLTLSQLGIGVTEDHLEIVPPRLNTAS